MLVTFLSPHLGTPAWLSTHKLLQAREHAPTLSSFTIFNLDLHLSLSRSLEACHNDSQVHSHLGNYTRARVVNVQSLGLKNKQTLNLSPQDTIKKVLKYRCLKYLCIGHLVLICMSYDQKKGRESN